MTLTAKTARYVLSVVYPDGVPVDVAYFTRPGDALTERDRRRAPRRRSEHWMVHDADDPERGYLEWPEEGE